MPIVQLGPGRAVAVAGPPEPLPATHRLLGVPICDRLDDPGIGRSDAALVDFTDMPVSTPDQLRIEAALDAGAAGDLTAATVLHVGVGNSQFARRFAPRCAQIDGVTVSPREKEHALAQRIPNYRVLRVSKYSTALPAALNRLYDVVVDNNIASFSCCEFHLLVLLANYRLLLKPGGILLTDEQGMAWSAGDDRWRLTPDDLKSFARTFRFDATPVQGGVWLLRRQ